MPREVGEKCHGQKIVTTWGSMAAGREITQRFGDKINQGAGARIPHLSIKTSGHRKEKAQKMKRA